MIPFSFRQMDILQATLAAGIMVKRYVPSYGDQPNDVQHVVKYFRDKFRGYHVSRCGFQSFILLYLFLCDFCCYFFFELFELFFGGMPEGRVSWWTIYFTIYCVTFTTSWLPFYNPRSGKWYHFSLTPPSPTFFSPFRNPHRLFLK